MRSHDALKSLSENALWEFLKWLAFGQGRHVGIRIEPRTLSSERHTRLQLLAENICRVVKQPDDVTLGITPPIVDRVVDSTALVAVVAEYVATRQIALYRNAADFEPRHAIEVQEDALRRIKSRLDLSCT